MEYRRIAWSHAFEDEPVMLYSEVEGDLELRKVDVYSNGVLKWADDSHSDGSTYLAAGPLPGLLEIALDPQFVPTVIDATEFERIWEDAVKTSK